MKKTILFTIICMFIQIGFSFSQLQYPPTKKVPHTDNYFGVEVKDDYQWMEDQQNPDLKDFVKEQNNLTFDYLSKIPFREKIRNRLTEIWNYPKFSAPFKQGDYYYFYKNDGLQNQSVIYRQPDLNSEPEVFLNPNEFSSDGTVSLQSLSFSMDSKYCVYGVSKAGSDWTEFFVMDVKSKTKLSDHLEWIKFSGASWQGYGFYYNKFDKPEEGKLLSSKNESPKIYFHKIGTKQSEDKLIYSDTAHPDVWVSIYTSEDENYLFKSVSKTGTDGNQLYYKKTNDKDYILIKDDFESSMYPINNTDDEVFLFTNLNAPKNKILKLNLKNNNIKFEEVIPEKTDMLTGAAMCKDKLVLVYRIDVSDRLYVYDLKGNMKNEIKLPGIGSAFLSTGKREDNEFFYIFASFTYPGTIFKYNIDTESSQLFKKSDAKFNMDDFTTEQVFFPSKDGTKIPMFIVHKKDIKLDGTNPAWLYAYGGFQVSTVPYFSISNIILLENGGVVAYVNTRGGDEYGEEWHKAGMLMNKQNVFDDFIGAAEYLINNKYTSPEKLALEGGSNGGLLVGTVINQRPELFKVAFPIVGVMDMLKFHKFTIGWNWVTEYGSSDDEVNFKNLIKYSPLHNIKEGLNYPAVMAFTSDHDDRVVPAHTFKYIAKLQEVYKGKNPVIVRIETDAGHGFGRSVKKLIDEQTDKWSFMFYNMEVTPIY
jgi:prolyl oligopeptidase